MNTDRKIKKAKNWFLICVHSCSFVAYRGLAFFGKPFRAPRLHRFTYGFSNLLRVL
jgi:hypothetical protein